VNSVRATGGDRLPSVKFVLVNHRTPAGASHCTECSRALRRGYLREVSTQRQYCDHDCYVSYEARSWPLPLLMPSLAAWRAVTRRDPQAATPYPSPVELMTSMVAANCWCSIAFAKAALHVSELMAAEVFDGD
jgi:hypothetical protein